MGINNQSLITGFSINYSLRLQGSGDRLFPIAGGFVGDQEGKDIFLQGDCIAS
ncbi:MAG: hypothetical protein O9276_22160 [Microcystis sp. LE17-20A]|uniref:hypothetical protein n=1 Tax=Microcystis TaxID=1125 RepID=UPI0019A7F869|nr:hypothetical protein [Microcystis sp. LE17-20A]MBD2116176.1 hypothetical protein [Microcystis wesenbergii FACHB-1339]MCZ8040728.1 hypothetical protein [Microcystis sp. LE17-20A]